MKPNIAFFDSGQGGLTVWESVLRRMPNLNTNYLGDNARYPYGNKGTETVMRYASEAAFLLAGLNAKLLVVACGTASSIAVQHLQNIFRIPVIGIVEGFCKDAVEISNKAGTIVVLGTRFTVASSRFLNVLTEMGCAQVQQKACPLFVPLVEEGLSSGSIVESVCDMYLWDVPSDVSVIMLACTHFPRLTSAIANSLAKRTNRAIISLNADGEWMLKPASSGGLPPIYLLDSSRSIVDSVSLFLHSHAHYSDFFASEQKLLCTDAPVRFAEVARVFASIDLPVAELIRIGS